MAWGLMASFPPAPSCVEPPGVGVSQPGRAEPGSSLSGLGLLINANPTPHSFLRTHNEDYSPSSLGKGLLGPHMEDAHPSYPLWVLGYNKGAGGTGWGPIPGEKNL